MTVDQLPKLSEKLSVEMWRAEMFVALGFKPKVALSLAEEGVDWHQMSALIGAGASLSDARRILT